MRAEKRDISYSDEVYRRYKNNTYVIWCWFTKNRVLLECRCRKRNYLMHRLAWQDPSRWMKDHLTDVNRPVIQLEGYVRWSVKESKTKLDHRETQVRQCQAIEKIFLEPNDELSSLYRKPLGECWNFRCQWQCITKYTQRSVVKPTAILGNENETRLCYWCPRLHETETRKS